ncbi:two-component system regulatory protein YycI [Evansella sp. AB-rgal1]|uniref:two-component system regulatory protein YycI n=1 Tax=Evansella sp. AB-rgal1 TaxID=3242696 RepID=UPI00359DA8B7
MDWSKTKTIFIITFLLLNVFLGYQLGEKRTAGNLNIINQVSFQDNLAENNIQILINDVEKPQVGSSIIGSTVKYDLETLEGQLLDQDLSLIMNDTMILADLVTPYKLSESSIEAGVVNFLQEFIINGDEYRFTVFNDENNTINVHQLYKEKPIDNFESGRAQIVLHLNEDLEIEAYDQIYIEISQEIREQEMLSLIKAIEVLFNNQYIPANTVLENAELGYYSLLPASGEFQVYAPMWKININGVYYYVNAIDGTIQTN